jgi:hypothetical protein
MKKLEVTKYVISNVELPKIEKDDRLVAHLHSKLSDVVKIYPAINSIRMLEEYPGTEYERTWYMYALTFNIEIEKYFSEQFRKYGPFHFELSHHDREARMHDGDDPYYVTRLRMRNGVRGSFYHKRSDATAEMNRILEFREKIAIENKNKRFEQYQKLKLEFEK